MVYSAPNILKTISAFLGLKVKATAMDTGLDYSQLVSNKYKNVLITPLIGAWEFLNRPKTASWQKDWEKINKLSVRYNWVSNLEINKILKEGQFAIVVTDEKQFIRFVSSEFESMTGYKSSEVLNRRPNFLQGTKTDPRTTQRIRKAISERRIVSETILNYRKDGTSYFCQVEIHPIFDRKQNLVNFIAIEKQL